MLWNIPRPVHLWTFILSFLGLGTSLNALIQIWFNLLSLVVSVGWYYSLKTTPVSANTAIYNSSPVWIFLFSIFFVKERVTIVKIVAVLMIMAGVVVVAFFGRNIEVCRVSSNPG